MSGDTADHRNSTSKKPSTLRLIMPDELDRVLDQARDEKWTDLALLGPGWTKWAPQDWPEELRGRPVFNLTSSSSHVEVLSRLQSLGSLQSLALWDLGLGAAAAESIAGNLRQLSSLDLRGNRVGAEGTKAIASTLKQLSSLGLARNQVGDEGAKAIASNLKLLSSLNLEYNQVGDQGAEAIASNLRLLSSLSLENNPLGDEGVRAIASNLKLLSSLNLRNNQVGDQGAEAIASNLKQLSSLNLRNNQVGDQGAEAIASKLKQLSSLNLSWNQVWDEGAKAIASNLKQLSSLDLGYNQVGDEGAKAVAKELLCLEQLDLAKNANIRSVDWGLVPSRLQRLNLADTNVADLSPLKALIKAGIPLKWDEAGYSEGIHVKGCPLVRPTPEIILHGHGAVLNYFREIEQQGVDHLYEAKVLLVGEGGAGKTSLLLRLYYPKLPLPTEDESTRGIDVRVQHFERAGGGPFRLNVWDFGGQQIYHATHQFFLTKNSLYVLVDDTRKDHKSVHDEGFKYWLEVVEAFGDKSPVLIFQNEKGGRSKTIDEAGIKGRFPNVLQTLRGDLSQANAAEDLRRAIEHVVQGLPHVGEAVPAKWVAIRAAIEAVAKQRPFISLDEYLGLYNKHLEPDRDKALLLSRYMHDIGVFLHFQDDLRLRKTVILRNHWATEAVFRVLDDEQVKSEHGYFGRSDCGRLWADSEYADMHMELLALMERFELCYQLPEGERWLTPQLLCASTPEYVNDWPAASDLVLSYHYDFLPRGLVSRLMVRMHRFVVHPKKSWANGALFEHQQTVVHPQKSWANGAFIDHQRTEHQSTELLALTESRGDVITLRARGPEKKALLSVIANALDELNASFSGLEGKIHKKVPCICERCRQVGKPGMFEEAKLLLFRSKGKQTIQCHESGDDVSVFELLDGMKLDQPPKWAQPPRPEKIVRIFLASSEELRADRDEFDRYMREQNDRLCPRGCRLEIVRWEDFLDAMSETRLQDEYNREVRACDIFVSLFMTKTGKFTEEEFDVAHACFTNTHKPLIYTYFKKPNISPTEEGLAGLTTLVNFKKKLKSLGHFPTEYESIEHLKRHFKDQLEKLEATNFEGYAPAAGR